MAGINKAILVGNLGKDPEIRSLESGRKVATFSMATTESYKDKDGNKHDSTEWHNIVFWGAIVEVIEKYLKKGSQIYVEGKIKNRSYEDKDGNKKYITEILADKLVMLGSSGNSQKNNQEEANKAIDDEDLPF